MKLLIEMWSQRMTKYSILIGIMGGVATFFGPDRLFLIKCLIGYTIGCLLLGEELPTALKKYLKWAKEYNRSTNK